MCLVFLVGFSEVFIAMAAVLSAMMGIVCVASRELQKITLMARTVHNPLMIAAECVLLSDSPVEVGIGFGTHEL